ncbi:MAG: ABC transporter ATP-binding protein [Candidatus Dormibacteraceae bacterium]
MSVAADPPPVASPGRAPALFVDGLSSSYAKSRVVTNVTLEVFTGQIALLIGRNGAGKTTALRAIAGVQPLDSGRVFLSGTDITTVPSFRRVRAGLALVPSGARAFGPLTVEENLRIIRGRRIARTAWTAERVYELFPKLRQLRKSASGSLSGGERQMLAVGRALMSNPTVIMLDEPSEGLAPVIVQAVAGLLAQLREAGIGVLLAEQNHHMAMRLADHCYFIEKGRIVASVPPAEAKATGLLQRYLGI